MKLKILSVMLLLIVFTSIASAVNEPTGLTGTAVSIHEIDWSWTVNNSWNTTVQIDAVNIATVTTPTSGTQSYNAIDSSWAPGSSHTISIRSYNATNTSSWVNSTVATETTGFSITNAIALIGVTGSGFIRALGTIFVNNLGIILTLVLVGIIIFIFSGFGQMIMSFIKGFLTNITEKMERK